MTDMRFPSDSKRNADVVGSQTLIFLDLHRKQPDLVLLCGLLRFMVRYAKCEAGHDSDFANYSVPKEKDAVSRII